MGANSKQRREAKKRRAQLQHQDRQRRGRESDPYPPGSSPFQAGQAPGPGQPTDAHRANGAVSMATAAIRSGDEDLLHHALDLLVALPERHGQRVGCTVVESVLMLSIRGLWSQGWQPLDAPHIVGKLLAER